MPSVSAAQLHFFRLVWAFKKGAALKIPAPLQAKVKEAAKGMTFKQVQDFLRRKKEGV